MVADSVDRLRTQAAQRPADIQIDAPLCVEADPGLVSVVIENLVANAWKYSRQKPVTRIEFGAARTDRGQAAYYLKDNGAGFDMRYANKLFQPFQRLHSATEFPGSGIGLATVRRIIERHGGEIWADSEIGKGSTFYFTLSPAHCGERAA